MPQVTYPLLSKLIDQFSTNRKTHICIHDASGVISRNPYLRLDLAKQVHTAPFCILAKLTATGLKNCLRCKTLTLKKALEEPKGFSGQCLLGITEIVRPVFHGNRLLCVIYLGNMVIKEQYQDTVEKIKRISLLTGVNSQSLLLALDTVEMVPASTIPDEFERAEIIAHFIELAHFQYTNLIRHPNPISPAFRGECHPAVRSMMDYIAMHYDAQINVAELAEVYGLSPDYLAKLFKKETGQTITEYINRVRIKHAQELLQRTNQTITDIALQTGFNSVSYFCRIFRRIVGCSPSEYKKGAHSTK